MDPDHHLMPLSVRIGLADGPSHRKLPSLERAGLRPFLGSSTASQAASDTVRSTAPVIKYVHCRGSDHDACVGALTPEHQIPEHQQAYNLHQGCHGCARGSKTATPLTSTSNSPISMYEKLYQLGCSTPSSFRPSSSNSNGSVSSTDSIGRRKRRRSESENLASGKITPPAGPARARPKPDVEGRKEKKEKEQDARNGQKEQVKEMEDLVIKYLGSEGMTELNQNNSKASGLKYKKVEVHTRAVTLIKTMACRIDELEANEEDKEQQIIDLQAELREFKGDLWSISQPGSSGCTSTRGSRL